MAHRKYYASISYNYYSIIGYYVAIKMNEIYLYNIILIFTTIYYLKICIKLRNIILNKKANYRPVYIRFMQIKKHKPKFLIAKVQVYIL